MHPIVLTDLDFADDIALISDSVRQASELLQRVESECSKVGLLNNYNKTKVMAYNTLDPIILKTADGQILYVEKDFNYLGSWINSSEKDIKVRKVLAWNALHSMLTLWKSKTNLPLKRRLFVATVESELLYGSESWTLNVKQHNSLDGTYTRMLRKALNTKWQEHVTNKEVYGKLPLVSSKIKARRMKMAVHCVCHPELSVHPLILWEPSQGKASRGRRRISMLIC